MIKIVCGCTQFYFVKCYKDIKQTYLLIEVLTTFKKLITMIETYIEYSYYNNHSIYYHLYY